ncbi:MAG TPA: hypothetical protein VJ829_04715 [Candidatus Binatia bacterium]|nr:hypothetical protein [Candidatus Binatia bacterium]
MSEQPSEFLLVPEQFLPSQLELPRSDSLICGEKALLLAVLEDAIRCLDHRSRSPGRLAREAEAWIRASDQRWPFSFVNVCVHLGIDADRLRTVLLSRVAARRAGGGAAKYRLHLRLKPRRARLRVLAEPRAVQMDELPRKAAEG